jgi:hypothetical protein
VSPSKLLVIIVKRCQKEVQAVAMQATTTTATSATQTMETIKDTVPHTQVKAERLT